MTEVLKRMNGSHIEVPHRHVQAFIGCEGNAPRAGRVVSMHGSADFC
jgi:hypothetical protein